MIDMQMSENDGLYPKSVFVKDFYHFIGIAESRINQNYILFVDLIYRYQLIAAVYAACSAAAQGSL